MKRTKLILLGMLAVLMLAPQMASAYTQPTVASYCYANAYTGGEPNPMMVLNITSTPNFTAYFWTNSSGAWIMAHSVSVLGPQATHPVFWNITSWYGANGSTTKYYWRYCIHNDTSASKATGWFNLSTNYTYTVRELTMGESIIAMIIPFISLIIGVSVIVFFMKGIGKFMKF